MKTRSRQLAKPYEDRIEAERLAKLDPKLQEAYNIPKDKRHRSRKMLAENAKRQIEPTWDVVVAAMTPEDKEKRAQLRVSLHEIEATEPDPLPKAYAYVNSERRRAAELSCCGWAIRRTGSIPWTRRCRACSRRPMRFRKTQ